MNSPEFVCPSPSSLQFLFPIRVSQKKKALSVTFRIASPLESWWSSEVLLLRVCSRLSMVRRYSCVFSPPYPRRMDSLGLYYFQNRRRSPPWCWCYLFCVPLDRDTKQQVHGSLTTGEGCRDKPMPPRNAQGSYKVRLSFYLNTCFTPYSLGWLQVPTPLNWQRMEYAGKRSWQTYLCIKVTIWSIKMSVKILFWDVGKKLAVTDIEACQTHLLLLGPLSDSSFMGLICATASRSLRGAGRHWISMHISGRWRFFTLKTHTVRSHGYPISPSLSGCNMNGYNPLYDQAHRFLRMVISRI